MLYFSGLDDDEQVLPDLPDEIWFYILSSLRRHELGSSEAAEPVVEDACYQ